MLVDVIQTGDMAQSILLRYTMCPKACHATIWGKAHVDPFLLHLDTRWRWVVNFMAWLLYSLVKGPWNPQARWPYNQSGCFGEGVNLFHILKFLQQCSWGFHSFGTQCCVSEYFCILVTNVTFKLRLSCIWNYVLSFIKLQKKVGGCYVLVCKIRSRIVFVFLASNRAMQWLYSKKLHYECFS